MYVGGEGSGGSGGDQVCKRVICIINVLVLGSNEMNHPFCGVQPLAPNRLNSMRT